jgi:hypothetical protein
LVSGQQYIYDTSVILISAFRPKNAKELFNLRHAQARNIVERIFGVVKRRWSLFTSTPEYPIETQAMFIAAIGALHNFVRIHDKDDDAADLIADDAGREEAQRLSSFIEEDPCQISPEELGWNIPNEETVRASARRDRIANQMWADYVAYLGDHGEEPNA